MKNHLVLLKKVVLENIWILVDIKKYDLILHPCILLVGVNNYDLICILRPVSCCLLVGINKYDLNCIEWSILFNIKTGSFILQFRSYSDHVCFNIDCTLGTESLIWVSLLTEEKLSMSLRNTWKHCQRHNGPRVLTCNLI